MIHERAQFNFNIECPAPDGYSMLHAVADCFFLNSVGMTGFASLSKACTWSLVGMRVYVCVLYGYC